jgi:outer membrane protein
MLSAASTRWSTYPRPVLAAIVVALLPAASPCLAETISAALARAYFANPDLNQQRAGVRAADENLPRATSAWRPTATATGQFGYNYLDLRLGAAARAALGIPPTGRVRNPA